MPHMPQWFALVLRSTHALAAGQYTWPVVGQRQVPIEHSWVRLQRVPHAPQLAASVCRFAQLPEQLVWPITQSTRHTPFEHTSPERQTVVHVPQWARSLMRLTQPTPAQSDWPVRHEHVPPVHD